MDVKVVEKVVEEAVKDDDSKEVEEVKEIDEEALRQERITACNKAIGDALQKYGCSLDASIMLRQGQVLPNIQIVPVELLKPRTEDAPAK